MYTLYHPTKQFKTVYIWHTICWFVYLHVFSNFIIWVYYTNNILQFETKITHWDTSNGQIVVLVLLLQLKIDAQPVAFRAVYDYAFGKHNWTS